MPTWSSRPNLVAPQTPVIWWFPFRKHWSNVLLAKPTTHRLFLAQRVQARPDGFSKSSRGNQNNWRVRFEPMELAAKLSNNSAPGIDCMPYAAWRQAGRLAVVILQSAAEHTQSKGFDVSASCKGLQRYFVVLPPKESFGLRSCVGDYCLPFAARPLSWVNTACRLVASACSQPPARLSLQTVRSPFQRGSLRGRQMLANALHFEDNIMRTLLAGAGTNGALTLFDLEVVSPIISQYVWTRVPASICRAKPSMWLGPCVTTANVGYSSAASHSMVLACESGVRQGC